MKKRKQKEIKNAHSIVSANNNNVWDINICMVYS